MNRCRALFATHYHELNVLTGTLASLTARTMAVKEWKGDIIFLHDVVKGVADRSYGIQVARLAGLPPAVITRAFEVLDHLEQQRHDEACTSRFRRRPAAVLARPCRHGAATTRHAGPSDLLREKLAAIDPDQLIAARGAGSAL